jgi:uncharacterized membrane protein
MARIDFAFGATEKIAQACQTTLKQYLAGHQLLVYCSDDTRLKAYDTKLWAVEPTAFVPHVMATDPLAEQTPIWLVSNNLEQALARAPAEAWLLVLIIFIWTPPHFWALALYRTNDYAKSGLPMLPITHGQHFTRLHILLYSIALFATTLLPYIVGMSGWLYLIASVVLGLIFIGYAFKLYRAYSDELSRQLFRFSILYLSLLFAALLADHWLIMVKV